jgi:cytochrome c oxidase subunit II
VARARRLTVHAGDGISPPLLSPFPALLEIPFDASVRWIVAGSVVAFLLVEALVAWSAFHRPVGEPRPTPGLSRRQEVVWMLTPALILFGLVGWTGTVLGRDVHGTPGEPDLTVHVVGHQFYWALTYEMGGKTVEVANNQLHLPLGKLAKIRLDSADVVHGFWVPQFRVKQTVVPGSTGMVWMQPMEPGEFNIVCAELCGNSHFAMRGFVHVDSPEEFAKWLAEYRSP